MQHLQPNRFKQLYRDHLKTKYLWLFATELLFPFKEGAGWDGGEAYYFSSFKDNLFTLREVLIHTVLVLSASIDMLTINLFPEM